MKNKKLTQKLEKCFSTLTDLREVIVQSNDAHEQLITEIDTCNADQDTLKADLRAAQTLKINLDLCNKSKLSLSTKTDELKRMLSEEGRQLLVTGLTGFDFLTVYFSLLIFSFILNLFYQSKSLTQKLLSN